ncbi:MAG: C-terminal helicase domain-containing protein, partial [Solirubrobacteraceae bacterium]
MHGDKSQSQREKALARFESGKVTTLVATDVAARGIDVTGVTHVINYDAPDAREDYVHRIGRTARAGASGVGITFVLDEQAREVAKFAAQLGIEHGLGVEEPMRGQRQGKPRPQGGGNGNGNGNGNGGYKRGGYSAKPRRRR